MDEYDHANTHGHFPNDIDPRTADDERWNEIHDRN